MFHAGVECASAGVPRQAPSARLAPSALRKSPRARYLASGGEPDTSNRAIGGTYVEDLEPAVRSCCRLPHTWIADTSSRGSSRSNPTLTTSWSALVDDSSGPVTQRPQNGRLHPTEYYLAVYKASPFVHWSHAAYGDTYRISGRVVRTIGRRGDTDAGRRQHGVTTRARGAAWPPVLERYLEGASQHLWLAVLGSLSNRSWPT